MSDLTQLKREKRRLETLLEQAWRPDTIRELKEKLTDTEREIQNAQAWADPRQMSLF